VASHFFNYEIIEKISATNRPAEAEKVLGTPSGRSPDWLKMKNPACKAVRREEEEDWSRREHPRLSASGRDCGTDYPDLAANTGHISSHGVLWSARRYDCTP
jgi:hypothetical protein